MDDRTSPTERTGKFGQSGSDQGHAAPEPALLRPDAASAWLGCSRSTLYRLVREDRLAAVRPFGQGELRFRVDDLRAFVANLDPSNRDV
jgi:excisionase family DNA binding protein